MTLTETLVAATLAWLLAFAPRLVRDGWTWHHHVAVAAILYPALRAILLFVDVAPSIISYEVLPPLTPEQLASIPPRNLRRHLLVPLAGLAIIALLGGLRTSRALAAPALKGPRAWARDLTLGLAIVPLIVGAEAIALALLAGPAAVLQTGDESARFANATIVHVLLLSLVPAVAEELYYRGLLQTAFQRALTGPRAAWLAIALQGILFGVAHAGYSTLSHLLGPLVFGLGMGYLRSTVGLGACVLAHFSVNLLYFSVDPGAGNAWLIAMAAAITLMGIAVLARERRTLWALARAGPEGNGPEEGG